MSWALLDVSGQRPDFVASTTGNSIKVCGRNISSLRLHAEYFTGGFSSVVSTDGADVVKDTSLSPDAVVDFGAFDGSPAQAAALATTVASSARWSPYASASAGGISGSGPLVSVVGFYRARVGSPLRPSLLHWGVDALGLTQGVWPPRAFASESDGCHAFFVTRGGGVAGWAARNAFATTVYSHLPQTRPVSAPAVDASCGSVYYCSIALADGSWVSGSPKGPLTAAAVRPGAFPVRLTSPVTAVASLYTFDMCFQYAASAGGDVVCSGGYTASSPLLPSSAVSADIVPSRAPANATLLACGVDACCSVGPGSAGGSSGGSTVASADAIWCWGFGMAVDYFSGTGMTARQIPIALPAGSGKRVLKIVVGSSVACALIATNGSSSSAGSGNGSPAASPSAAGHRDGVPAGTPVSGQAASTAPWFADTVAVLADAGAVYCWGRASYGRAGTNGVPDRTAPVRVAVPPVLDISCVQTGCGVLAVGSNTGAGATVADDANALDWGVWLWGTPPFTAFLRDLDGLAPRRLADPPGVLRGLASLTGPRRLNCNRAYCVVTSPIGMHFFGAGFAQMLRSPPPGTVLPFTISRDAPSLAYDGVSPFGPAVAALALRAGESSRMTYAAIGAADGTLAVRSVDLINALGLTRSSATNVWQAHAALFASGMRLAAAPLAPASIRPFLGNTILSGGVTGFAAVGNTGDVFATAAYGSYGRISPGNVVFVSVDTAHGANSPVRLAIAANGTVWLQGGAADAFFTPNSSSTNPFPAAAFVLTPTPLLPPVTSACYMVEAPTLCATFSNGSLVCGGKFAKLTGMAGLFGLVDSDTVWPFLPPVGLPGNISFVRCKVNTVCALLTNGTLFCGGTDGGRGRLGAGNSITANSPVSGSSRWLRVLLPEPAVDFCNIGFAAAVTISGSVYVWGDANSVPRLVALPLQAVRVSCGEDSIAIVALNGSVWAVGINPDLLMSDAQQYLPDPVPSMRQSAFRSAASLHEGPLAALKFGPAAHANLPADPNPVHTCHRLVSPTAGMLTVAAAGQVQIAYRLVTGGLLKGRGERKQAAAPQLNAVTIGELKQDKM